MILWNEHGGQMERELEEAVEKARQPFERKVGATMAIVAAALALVTVYGHVTTTEELLLQQKASDQWAYYQAKSIRRYQSQVAHDVLSALTGPAAEAAGRKYESNEERYRKDSDAIEEKANELEHESGVKSRQALRLHLGEIFLEMAIVVSSLALLTRRPRFWLAGVVASLAGAAISATAFLVH
jgi:hypothetical protein